MIEEGDGIIRRSIMSIRREYIGRLGMCHGWYVEGLSGLGEWERVEVYESCVMEMGDMSGCYVRLLGDGEELLFRLGMGGEE